MERQIDAGHIIADIQSGMTVRAIAKKHGVMPITIKAIEVRKGLATDDGYRLVADMLSRGISVGDIAQYTGRSRSYVYAIGRGYGIMATGNIKVTDHMRAEIERMIRDGEGGQRVVVGVSSPHVTNHHQQH